MTRRYRGCSRSRAFCSVFFAALAILGFSNATEFRMTPAALAKVANDTTLTKAVHLDSRGKIASSKTACKIVTKKVHGKATRVRVCSTPPAKQALKLVKALASAKTKPARQRALGAVMKALHIGVYTAKGKRVLRGSERNSSDLYLYDFEMGSIGLGFASGRRWSLDELGAILSSAGIMGRDGKPLVAATLGPILSASMKAAPSVLEPLLLRRLGLTHKPTQDLKATITPQKIRLDALQLFILVADVLGTRIHALQAPKLESRLSTRPISNHLAPLENLQQAGQCGSFGSGAQPPLSWSVNWLGSREGNSFFTNERDAGTIVDDVHGTVLGQIMLNTYVETPNGTDTHEGDPQAGPDLIYRFHVSLDVIKSPSVTCGPLLGLSLPKAGPLPNIKVSIDTGDLDKYGKVSYSPSDQHTGQNGVVQMTFTPKNEDVPGFGQVVTRSSLMSATLDLRAYDSTGHSLSSGIGQNLFPLRWAVSRHAPRGFKFSGLKYTTKEFYGEMPNVQILDEELSGHFCGETPYVDSSHPLNLWTWHTKETTTDITGSGTDTNKAESDGPIGFVPGLNGTLTNSTQETVWAYQLVPGPMPQLRLTVTVPTDGQIPGHHFEPAVQTVSVPVTEDTSCPAPTL